MEKEKNGEASALGSSDRTAMKKKVIEKLKFNKNVKYIC